MLLVLVQSLLQSPQEVGDGLDEATGECRQQRAELLGRDRTRLLQELEQGSPEQSRGAWGALLGAALQQWHFWARAGVLLLSGLCFSCRKRSHEADSSGKDESSIKNLGEEKEKEQEGGKVDTKEDKENNDMNVEADDSDTGNEEGRMLDANEGDNDDANEGNDVKVEEDDVGNKDGSDANKDLEQ